MAPKRKNKWESENHLGRAGESNCVTKQNCEVFCAASVIVKFLKRKFDVGHILTNWKIYFIIWTWFNFNSNFNSVFQNPPFKVSEACLPWQTLNWGFTTDQKIHKPCYILSISLKFNQYKRLLCGISSNQDKRIWLWIFWVLLQIRPHLTPHCWTTISSALLPSLAACSLVCFKAWCSQSTSWSSTDFTDSVRDSLKTCSASFLSWGKPVPPFLQ